MGLLLDHVGVLISPANSTAPAFLMVISATSAEFLYTKSPITLFFNNGALNELAETSVQLKVPLLSVKLFGSLQYKRAL